MTDMESFSDETLVHLVRMGDASAVREMVSRYDRRLYRIARAVLRDAGEAEDVVQETFMRALANIADFRGESSLSTWLTRITLNEAFGRLRRRRPTVELRTLDQISDADRGRVLRFPDREAQGDPESIAARREIRQVLERAIDELPEPFRVVFVMRIVEEMSTQETAAVLDLRPETVRTRLHRARQLLRDSIGGRLGSVLTEIFPFEDLRCAQLGDAVLSRLVQAGCILPPTTRGYA